jgi:hypothetical protein
VAGTSRQLDYAASRPWYRRVWTRDHALRLVVAAVGIAAVLVMPALWRRVQLIGWQRQCLSYSSPPTKVVYESTGPSSTADLIAPWVSFHREVSGTRLRTNGTIFLHERQTQSGVRRLVAVEVTRSVWPAQRVELRPAARLFTVGSHLRPPVEVLSQTNGGGLLPFDASDTIRIYAGQPDPNDPSHFTVDYEVNGVRRTVDGWLRDPHTIVIERRE